jgi:hypothetical protein
LETSRFAYFLGNGLADGGEVVSLTLGPPFAPRKIPRVISVGGRFDPKTIVRLDGLGQLRRKNDAEKKGEELCSVTYSEVLNSVDCLAV